MKRRKKARRRRQGITLVEVFTHVMGAQEMTSTLMGKVDAMAADNKAHFEIIENRLNKHDARFDQLEGRFETLEGRFDTQESRLDALHEEVKGFRADVTARFDDHEKRIQALEHPKTL